MRILKITKELIMKIKFEQIEEDYFILDAVKDEYVRIWSGEHKAYWRPKANGYTPDGLEAGVWLFKDAWDKTKHCDASKKIEFRIAA